MAIDLTMIFTTLMLVALTPIILAINQDFGICPINAVFLGSHHVSHDDVDDITSFYKIQQIQAEQNHLTVPQDHVTLQHYEDEQENQDFQQENEIDQEEDLITAQLKALQHDILYMELNVEELAHIYNKQLENEKKTLQKLIEEAKKHEAWLKSLEKQNSNLKKYLNRFKKQQTLGIMGILFLVVLMIVYVYYTWKCANQEIGQIKLDIKSQEKFLGSDGGGRFLTKSFRQLCNDFPKPKRMLQRHEAKKHQPRADGVHILYSRQ